MAPTMIYVHSEENSREIREFNATDKISIENLDDDYDKISARSHQPSA